MIVLDANILIRAILGRRVRQMIEDYSLQESASLHLTSPSTTLSNIYLCS